MDEKKMATMFKALCDENRIRILKLLRGGEMCACKLLEELNVTQPIHWIHQCRTTAWSNILIPYFFPDG